MTYSILDKLLNEKISGKYIENNSEAKAILEAQRPEQIQIGGSKEPFQVDVHGDLFQVVYMGLQNVSRDRYGDVTHYAELFVSEIFAKSQDINYHVLEDVGNLELGEAYEESLKQLDEKIHEDSENYSKDMLIELINAVFAQLQKFENVKA